MKTLSAFCHCSQSGRTFLCMLSGHHHGKVIVIGIQANDTVKWKGEDKDIWGHQTPSFFSQSSHVGPFTLLKPRFLNSRFFVSPFYSKIVRNFVFWIGHCACPKIFSLRFGSALQLCVCCVMCLTQMSSFKI